MIRSITTLAATCAFALLTLSPAWATVIDDWAAIKAPPPPVVAPVTVDASTTALLLLDFVKQTCGGPKCMAAIPAMTKLLAAARAHHVAVVYSYTGTSTLADTLPPLAPMAGEPAVQGPPDKYLGSNLAQILASKGIKTVIVCGMSANGAVLYTASHAAMTGLNVVVPIDGAPSETPYAEQFVLWNLTNGPRISTQVKLTTSDNISF